MYQKDVNGNIQWEKLTNHLQSKDCLLDEETCIYTEKTYYILSCKQNPIGTGNVVITDNSINSDMIYHLFCDN